MIKIKVWSKEASWGVLWKGEIKKEKIKGVVLTMSSPFGGVEMSEMNLVKQINAWKEKRIKAGNGFKLDV